METRSLIGKRFGYLLVEEIRKTRCTGNIEYLCKCDCGNYKIATDNQLLTEIYSSCGKHCKAKKPKDDLTGQTFGHLLVLNFAGKEDDRYLWNCLCTCGKTVVKNGTGLKAGCYKSCGHIVSHGETETERLLTEKHINFQKQYSFSDLRGPKNGRLRFDFAVLTNNNNLKYLIEYQGEQHYIERSNRYFGQQQREITDKKKKEYCKEHKIPLYEIRYDENIEERLNSIIKQEDSYVRKVC